MAAANVPRFRMFAGPNGSGKTTLIHGLAKEFTPLGLFRAHYFINADDILRSLHGDGFELATLGISLSVEQLCERLVAIGRLTLQQVTDARLEVSDG